MLVNGVDHEDEIAIVRAQLMAWCHCFEAHKHEGAHKTGCKIKGDNKTLICIKQLLFFLHISLSAEFIALASTFRTSFQYHSKVSYHCRGNHESCSALQESHSPRLRRNFKFTKLGSCAI